MTQITAIIEQSKDGSWWVYTDLFHGAGATIDEAKADMKEQIAFYIDTCVDMKIEIPDWLKGAYEIIYK